MNKFRPRIVAVVFFILLTNFVFACAHKGLSDTEAEKWEMQLTGNTVGKVNLLLQRKQIEKDVYDVTGKFGGMVTDYGGGGGLINGTLSGKIKGNVFQTRIAGSAKMASEVEITGTIKGTISQFQGSGTYFVSHDEGSSAGKWTMERIRPPQ